MSLIEKLIGELCPDGVKYVPLSAVADVGTGSSNRNESTGQGTYPFYVRSKTVYLTDEFEFDEEAIIIPGEGGIGEIFTLRVESMPYINAHTEYIFMPAGCLQNSYFST